MDSWLADLNEIAEHANPGNKIRSLHLTRNMMQCKAALERLLANETKN